MISFFHSVSLLFSEFRNLAKLKAFSIEFHIVKSDLAVQYWRCHSAAMHCDFRPARKGLNLQSPEESEHSDTDRVKGTGIQMDLKILVINFSQFK